MFENRALRRILGPKREKEIETEEDYIIMDEKNDNLYSSPDLFGLSVKEDDMSMACSKVYQQVSLQVRKCTRRVTFPQSDIMLISYLVRKFCNHNTVPAFGIK
jgi:hypothetical protein